MGVPVLEVFSADPKKAVTTMLKKCDRMHGPLYHFQTVQEILQRAGWCSLYSAHIQIPIGALFILPIFKYPLLLSLFYPFKYPLADRTFLWQDFRALHSALNVRLVGRRADGNLTRKAKL